MMKHLDQISYEECGTQHNGTPIICLHGIGGSRDSFLPQLDALSDTYRVLAWDMPGYGQSEQLAETNFSTLTQALTDVMDALAIQQAHIIGHSIGGMIAQELAIASPKRVASLALLATTASFGGRDDHFKQRFLAARLQPLDEGKSMSALADEFVPEIVGSVATDQTIKAAADTMRQVPTQTYRAIMQCLIQFDRFADSHLIQQPCCLIAGDEDNNAPARTMRKMADKIPHSTFFELEHTGHLINLEAPERCNHILRHFFSGLSQ